MLIQPRKTKITLNGIYLITIPLPVLNLFFIVRSRVRRKVTRFSPGTRARTRKQRTKKPTTDVNDALEIGSFLPYEDEFSRHVYSDYDSDIGNSQGAIRQADDTICTESVKISAVNQNLPKSDQDVISSKVLSFL